MQQTLSWTDGIDLCRCSRRHLYCLAKQCHMACRSCSSSSTNAWHATLYTVYFLLPICCTSP